MNGIALAKGWPWQRNRKLESSIVAAAAGDCSNWSEYADEVMGKPCLRWGDSMELGNRKFASWQSLAMDLSLALVLQVIVVVLPAAVDVELVVAKPESPLVLSISQKKGLLGKMTSPMSMME